MPSSIRAKYNDWIVVFVVLPAAISMAVCIFFFWHLLKQNHRRILDDQVAVETSAIEQILHAESLRLRTLLAFPATESLISVARRRAATGAQSIEAKTETTWEQADRSDMIVRSVLDNDIAILFRQTSTQFNYIKRLLLTDGSGSLLAASEKLPSYNQTKTDWWPLLRQAKQDEVLSEAATGSGLLGLIVPRLAENGALIAAARVEISLADLVRDVLIPTHAATNDERIMVFLVGQDARAIQGPENMDLAAVGSTLGDFINKSGDLDGWFNGYRYESRAVDAGILWARPLWIVAARAESSTPIALYGPLLLATAIAIAAVFGIFVFSRNVGARLFFEPMREAAEAGVWVLRQAGHEAGALAAGGLATSASAAAHPWSKIEYEQETPLHRELDRWVSQVREQATGESAQISIALKHDIELATEFQQAFMNRPTPEIPEVYTEGRLRLDFSHFYRPALALGGDFFDIEAVGPDCAGIFIGDVMGHGTRSALLTSTIRTLLTENYRLGRNPVHFLKELNRSLHEILAVLPDQFFASACYFAADTIARIGTYSLAGHPPPFHLHRNLGRIVRLEKPKPRGAALGILPDEEFGAGTVRLVDGDVFVFYTDGAYEASNSAGEMFGLSRLEKSLQAHIYEQPKEMLEKVVKDVEHFVEGHPLEDDICLVAVLVTTKPPEKKS